MGTLSTAEAYDALSAFAGTHGRNTLLLLLHASVPETLRPDTLHLIQINFLAGCVDPSLEVDVLFAPFTTCLGGDYYRVDAQVRWHGLALLRSLYREDPRGREIRVAELLWCHLAELDRCQRISPQTLLSDYIEVQRWVALAYLEPSEAARAFATALRAAEAGSSIAAYGQLGGLAAAMELPLAGEPELLTYARGLDALAKGDEPNATRLLEALGDQPLVIGDVNLRAPTEWLRRLKRNQTPSRSSDSQRSDSQRRELVISYCHADTEWADKLSRMITPLLRGSGQELRLLEHSQYAPGAQWREALETALAEAKVVVLLVSPEYLASEFVMNVEVPKLLAAAEAEVLRILWVPLQPSLVMHTSIQAYQALLDPSRPLAAMNQVEQMAALLTVAQSIKAAIQSVRAREVMEQETTEPHVQAEKLRRRDLFICYSRTDRKWTDALRVILRPLENSYGIYLWDDSLIAPGSRWLEEIDRALASAKVALLLVSPDFLNSDFIHKKELPHLLRAAEEDGLVLLWVKLRPCLVHLTPIHHYHAALNPARSLSTMAQWEQQAALATVAKRIVDAFQSICAGEGKERETKQRQEIEEALRRRELFISYSRADREWVDRLKAMLDPLVRGEDLHLWDDSQIEQGARWQEEIAQDPTSAKVALLLVSPDFLNSDFIHKEELLPLLRAAEKEGLVLVWVKLRPCLVQHTPLYEYQAALDPARPLSAMAEWEQEVALEKVAQCIEAAFQGTREPKQPSQADQPPAPLVITALFPRHFRRETANLLRVGSGWQVERRSLEVQGRELALGEGVSLPLIEIPAGHFMMGSPVDEPGYASDEGPQHRVWVEGFLMGQTPVTQAQWRTVVGRVPPPEQRWERELPANPSHFVKEPDSDKRPVENVRWQDAMEFCRRLSAFTGAVYTLPSEAQWEYACRAGTITPFAFGETITPELANYDSNHTYVNGPKGKYRGQTMPVGSFPANAWGLQDMHGNVWEWCLDHWHGNYKGAPIDGNAWLNKADEKMVARLLRGGSWFDVPHYCRSAKRLRNHPANVGIYIGFRVCCLPQGLSS